MPSIFLHGGGDHPDSRAATFGRFAAALNGSGPLLLVIAEADTNEREANAKAYREIFEAVGVASEATSTVFVSTEEPLSNAILSELKPAGVFVCGGATPYYHQSVCADLGWLSYLKEANIPYGGTSAGAAIAAQAAIIGGWRAERGGRERAILFSGAGEGLSSLTVMSGLGLVPFAVDVHASQWGTLLRLVHAVELGVVPSGWAVDEDTLLEVTEAGVTVYGRGQAYQVQPASNGVSITIHAAL
jgi:cyanophycinase